MHRLGVVDIIRGLRARDFSALELTEALLARATAHNDTLNALITISDDRARDNARTADQALSGPSPGALAGVPLVHKDLFCTQGMRTSCGSRMLDNFLAPYDATVVQRLADAGTVLIGKSNMDEFAMGSSNENSYYGPTRNPWDLTRVPGGSSGGSAAAVAAGLVPLATATDTGGSIRQPAAMCGITGLKPTYGRVSRYGMVAFASSLDQGGLMARSAADIATAFGHMAGFDPRDSTSMEHPVDDYCAGLEADLSGLRIGLAKEHFDDRLDPRVATVIHHAIGEFERLGASVHEVELPHADLAVPAYYVIAPAECSSNLSRFDGVRFGHRAAGITDLDDLYERSRSEGFGAEVKRRIMIGTYALSAGYYDAYYLKAQRCRRLVAEDFSTAFTSVDVLMGPAAPTTAFAIGEKTDDPITMYLSDIHTISVNLAGLPGMSLPAGFVDGLPVGLQIIGNHFQEARLLNIAHRFQQLTDWHTQRPRGFE